MRLKQKCLITMGCSSAVLMRDRSSSAVLGKDSVLGRVCVLQDGNSNTAGRSTVCSLALHNKHQRIFNIL